MDNSLKSGKWRGEMFDIKSNWEGAALHLKVGLPYRMQKLGCPSAWKGLGCPIQCKRLGCLILGRTSKLCMGGRFPPSQLNIKTFPLHCPLLRELSNFSQFIIQKFTASISRFLNLNVRTGLHALLTLFRHSRELRRY